MGHDFTHALLDIAHEQMPCHIIEHGNAHQEGRFPKGSLSYTFTAASIVRPFCRIIISPQAEMVLISTNT